MNVRLERNWVRQGFDITFYERQPLRIMRLGEHGPTWEQISEAEPVVEPTLRLPEDALAALLAEAEKVIPASHATERHLNDAVAVRDRLLTLVESGWSAP